jgi:hypothetical protein
MISGLGLFSLSGLITGANVPDEVFKQLMRASLSFGLELSCILRVVRELGSGWGHLLLGGWVFLSLPTPFLYHSSFMLHSLQATSVSFYFLYFGSL